MIDLGGASIPASDLPDDSLLTRKQVALALTEVGFPISVSTLASKACELSGPPYVKFGSRTLYTWGACKQWAANRVVVPSPMRPRLVT
jgi:hypothetical protein